MESDELRLELDGPHGGIDAHALAEGLEHLLKLLESLPGDPDATSRWQISDLSVGSAKLAVRGDARVVRTAVDGIRQLRQDQQLPRGWSRTSLQAFHDLTRVVRRPGVEGLKIEGIDTSSQTTSSILDDELRKIAADLLAPPPPSLGSVRGILFRYNHDRLDAGLRDARIDTVIKVSFPATLAAIVRSALTAEVLVWGEVHRDTVGKIDYIRAEGLEQFGEPQPQSVDAIAGIFDSNWTGGLSSVEWVRKQRDE